MHTITTAELKTWISKPYEKSEGFTERSCRSAVCGGDPFIPDTEYDVTNKDMKNVERFICFIFHIFVGYNHGINMD